MSSLDLAQQRLRAFAEEAAGISPLYEHLASRAAEDPEVADLLTAAGEDNVSGELLLAAAHRLAVAHRAQLAVDVLRLSRGNSSPRP